MARSKSGSSARGARTKKKGGGMRDRDIDYSDIPALTDGELRRLRPVGRPLLGSGRRKLVAIRLDPVVLLEIRAIAEKKGLGYQTLINQILSDFAKKRSA